MERKMRLEKIFKSWELSINGGCLDSRNAILSSTVGSGIRYLSLLTNSTCNEWMCPWCSDDALVKSTSKAPLHIQTSSQSSCQSLLVVQRDLCDPQKGQLKPEGKSKDGSWGMLVKNIATRDDPEFEAKSSGFSQVPIHSHPTKGSMSWRDTCGWLLFWKENGFLLYHLWLFTVVHDRILSKKKMASENKNYILFHQMKISGVELAMGFGVSYVFIRNQVFFPSIHCLLLSWLYLQASHKDSQ